MKSTSCWSHALYFSIWSSLPVLPYPSVGILFFPGSSWNFIYLRNWQRQTILLPQCMCCLLSNLSPLVSHFHTLLCIILRLPHMCAISFQIDFKFIFQRSISLPVPFSQESPVYPTAVYHFINIIHSSHLLKL